MGHMRSAYTILVVKAEKKRPLEDLDVDVEIRGCIKKFPD
jgi:hypothetical protein